MGLRGELTNGTQDPGSELARKVGELERKVAALERQVRQSRISTNVPGSPAASLTYDVSVAKLWVTTADGVRRGVALVASP